MKNPLDLLHDWLVPKVAHPRFPLVGGAVVAAAWVTSNAIVLWTVVPSYDNTRHLLLRFGGLAALTVAGVGMAWLARLVGASFHRRPLAARPPGPPVALRREKAVILVAALLLLTGATVQYQIGDLLQGFHQPGDARIGVGAATGFTALPTPGRMSARLCDAVVTWSRYARPRQQPEQMPGCKGSADPTSGLPAEDSTAQPFPEHANAPITVLGWQLGVDGIFVVPAYAFMLLLIVAWARVALAVEQARIYQTARWDAAGSLRRLGTLAGLAIVVAVLADLIENALAAWLLAQSWRDYNAGGSMPLLFDFWSLLPLALGLSTGLKWAGILLAVAFLLWGGYVLLRHGGSAMSQWARLPGLVRALLVVRVQIVAVVLFCALFPFDQVAELYWRWTDRPGNALWGTLFGAMFAALIFLTGRWLMERSGKLPRKDVSFRWALRAAMAVALILLLVIAIGDRTIKPLLPFLLALAIILLGLPIGSWPRTGPGGRAGFGRALLPALLAGIVAGLLGAGALGAGVELRLYAYLRDGDPGNWWILLLPPLALTLLVVGFGVTWILSSGDIRMPRFMTRRRASPLDWEGPVALLACATLLWLAIALWIQDADRLQDWAPRVGVIGLISIALLLLTLGGSGLIALVDWALPHPPNVFRAFRLDRSPVILFLCAWLLVAAVMPPGPRENIHDVRLEPSTGAVDDRESARVDEQLEGAFAWWRWHNCLVADAPLAAGDKPAVPLVLIATSGGGIRAATWTTYVMDQVVGYDRDAVGDCAARDPTERATAARVFAASGVSGGSVGLATWATRLVGDDPAPDAETCADCAPSAGQSDDEGWIRQQMQSDVLAPTLAWMLFVEAPWWFLRGGVDRGRAAVLDETWERRWGFDDPDDAPGMFELRQRERDWEQAWASSPDDIDALSEQMAAGGDQASVPLLMLNGTSVETGCRFNGAVLDSNAREASDPSTRCLAPDGLQAPAEGVLAATVDLVDFLCAGQDMPLATAALLSARFPIFSPAGHLEQCRRFPRERASDAEYRTETFVVDGGYLEGAGAASIVDLWTALEPLVEQHNQDPRSRAYIIPFMIQIDNGYAEPAAPAGATAPPQFLAPLRAVIASRSGNNARERQAGQLIFSKPYAVDYGDDGDSQVLAYCQSRYALFPLRAHPGPQARLGWVLSSPGLDDLQSQLVELAGEQDGPLQQVAAWFDSLRLEPVSGVTEAGCVRATAE